MVAKSGWWRGGEWRVAPAILQLWEEANALAPRRDRSSDGTIGDPAHAARQSNHNPQESGRIDWVDAIDIDHDPVNGMDIHARVRQWVAALDERLDEVISNGWIWTWARRHEGWRRYKGSNPHTHHAHITVRDSHRHDTRPWFVGALAFPTPGPPPYRPPAPPAPLSEEDDMPKLIRCNDRAHAQFGAVWAVSGLTRTPVTAADYDRWRFFAGAPAECDGATFDWFMRATQDTSNWGAVALTILYVRTVLDRVADKLAVKR